jgi:hypothetical protein
MEVAFEAQYVASLENVNRKPTRRDSILSTLNVLILMLGFAAVAAGYVISNMPRERLAELFGAGSVSIERHQSVASLEKSATKISKTLLDLLR